MKSDYIVWMMRACLPCDVFSQESRLCVLRLAYLLTVIFSCEISTRTSVLHFGQYSGEFWTTVSSCTLFGSCFHIWGSEPIVYLLVRCSCVIPSRTFVWLSSKFLSMGESVHLIARKFLLRGFGDNAFRYSNKVYLHVCGKQSRVVSISVIIP